SPAIYTTDYTGYVTGSQGSPYNESGGHSSQGVLTYQVNYDPVHFNLVQPRGIALQTITDGTSNTLLVGESSFHKAAQNYYMWSLGCRGPQAFGSSLQDSLCPPCRNLAYQINFNYGYPAANNDVSYGSEHFGNGANLLMCDGSVRYLTTSTPLSLL